jgi:two-component system, LytTR family, response regulator
MIKAIIVDDEPSAGEIIRKMIDSRSDEVQVCSTCQNIADAVRDIQLYQPDLLFLDIELADGSGFDILEQLPALDAHIIFVTAHEHYSLQAIKRHAFDYILKPVDPEEFKTALGKAIQSIRQATAPPAADALLQYFRNLNSRKIAVPNKNGFSYYNIEEIISLEAAGSYTRIHFSNNKQILVSRGLRDFELHLAEKGFLRVHKSYLINMEYIAEFHRGDNGYLVMSDGSKIHLSSKDKGEIIKKIKEFSNII